MLQACLSKQRVGIYFQQLSMKQSPQANEPGGKIHLILALQRLQSERDGLKSRETKTANHVKCKSLIQTD